MSKRSQNITVDLYNKSYNEIFLKQFDTTEIIFTILENGYTFSLSGVTAEIWFVKPNGAVVQQSATIENEKVKASLVADCVRAYGRGKIEVSLIQNDEVISSFQVDVKIEKSGKGNSSSDNTPSYYEKLENIVETENARQLAETARANAETARESAESNRASAETARATAETARASAETTRAANETARQESYNSQLGEFNLNAAAKTTAFNDNATSKTNAFNSNATEKTTDFNTNATSKTNAFNNNATEKVGDVNTAKNNAIAAIAAAEASALGNLNSLEKKHNITRLTVTTEIQEETDYTLPVNYIVGSGNLVLFCDNEILIPETSDHDGNYVEVGENEAISNKVQFGWNVEVGTILTIIVKGVVENEEENE